MTGWNVDKVTRLIELYELQRVLWDVRHPKHHLRKEKLKSLAALQDDLSDVMPNVTINEIAILTGRLIDNQASS